MSKCKKIAWIICTVMLFISCSYNRNDYYSIKRMKDFNDVEFVITNPKLSGDTLSFILSLKANNLNRYDYYLDFSKNVYLLVRKNNNHKIFRLERMFLLDNNLITVKLPNYYDDINYMIIGDFFTNWGVTDYGHDYHNPVGKIKSDWYHVKNDKI